MATRWLFIFWLSIHCILLRGVSIDSMMTEEERVSTGLNRLSKVETEALDQWLCNHALPYHSSAPLVRDPTNLKWVFETRRVNYSTGSDSEQKPFDLSIGVITQNEANFLEEWIEYHLALGVQHFYIYDHLSTDHTLAVLEPYIAEGIVELVRWTSLRDPDTQLCVCSDMIHRSRGKTRWLAVIDIDEFLNPYCCDNLIDFLLNYEEYAGVCINWQFFGTSEIESLPPQALSLEHFVRKFPVQYEWKEWNWNRAVKSIVKPERVSPNIWTCHTFDPIDGYLMVDTDKNAMEDPWTRTAEVLNDKIVINHYWFRSLDWFHNVKLKRHARLGVPRHYSTEKIDRLLTECNAVHDSSIHRFLPEVAPRVAARWEARAIRTDEQAALRAELEPPPSQ